MVIAAKSAGQLAPTYDVVVVGSGYGGGVAASRMARMGLRVAVLEQGRHWRPGDFPTTAKARRKATRVVGRRVKMGDPAGLYRLSVGKGLTVFAATGIGGGSLINAGVVLRPSFDRLRKAGWPDAVLDDGHFHKGLSLAETMLGVAPAPEPERFAKFAGMQRAADAAGVPVQAPPMTISHKPGKNVSGVMQYACRNCGDCWSGCNVGAKNTVGVTYITDAVDHGAEIFCESRVESLRRANGASDEPWEVTVQDLSAAGGTQRVSAHHVVLGAGTLGTNELLLRAQRDGLPVSSRLGQGFSANGDDLVIATQLSEPVNDVAIGFPPQATRNVPPVGPHSMALIDLGDEDGPVWAHDGTMLTMMAHIAPLKALFSGDFRRALKLMKGGIYGDEQSRTQVYYLVAEDSADGRLELKNDRVVVDWPDYSDDPRRVAAEKKARAMIEGMGGVFQSNPFALSAFGGNRIIAHPLGGCGMADSAEDGVVAPDGRVFDPSKGSTAVHDGLYVCDGAAIPTSVGVSPLLTITALAERAMTLAAQRLERDLDIVTRPDCGDRDAAM